MATGTQIWVPVFLGALLGKVLRENIWQFQLKSVILQREPVSMIQSTSSDFYYICNE